MERLDRALPPLARTLFWLVLAWQLVAYRRLVTDDAFIFYRYAANLAAGHGYAFNAGERVLGTTSPLYTLLLAAAQVVFGRLPGVDLPLLGGIISAASLAVIALLVADFFRRAGRRHGALLAPLVVLAVALFQAGVGMDVLPAIALGLAAIRAYDDGRTRSAGALAGLAVLARPDLAVVPALLVLDALVVRRVRPGWRAAVIFAAIVGAWLAFSRAYFGSMVPVSVSAKLDQGGSVVWGGSWSFVREWTKQWPCHASIKDATLVLAGLAVPFAVAAGRRYRGFRCGWLVILWSLSHFVAYGLVIRPPAYPWYFTQLAPGLAVVLVSGADAVATYLRRRGPVVAPAAMLAAVLWLGWAGSNLAFRLLREPAPYKYRFYAEAAAWLNERAPQGAVVACNEIGVLGYFYAKGPLLDTLGLTNPDVAAQVRSGDFAWPIRRFLPEYVIFKEPPFPGLEDLATDPWFLERYAREAVFGDGPTKIGLHRRRSDKS